MDEIRGFGGAEWEACRGVGAGENLRVLAIVLKRELMGSQNSSKSSVSKIRNSSKPGVIKRHFRNSSKRDSRIAILHAQNG